MVTPQSITGWAQNPEHPAAPVCLDIFIGGQLIGRTLANLYRADLQRAGIGSGHHSFVFPLPSDRTFATRAIEVRRSHDGAVLQGQNRMQSLALPA
jgi:hypothetical protein